VGELALTEHCHRFEQAAGISQHEFWNETAHADLNTYVGALAAAFGDRLRFPVEFVGRGDMSRGGLLLRSGAVRLFLARARATEPPTC